MEEHYQKVTLCFPLWKLIHKIAAWTRLMPLIPEFGSFHRCTMTVEGVAVGIPNAAWTSSRNHILGRCLNIATFDCDDAVSWAGMFWIFISRPQKWSCYSFQTRMKLQRYGLSFLTFTKVNYGVFRIAKSYQSWKLSERLRGGKISCCTSNTVIRTWFLSIF